MNKKLFDFWTFLLGLGIALSVQVQSVCAGGENPAFVLPVACHPGKDCWVVNYVDVEPAMGAARDFRCHARTYDGHKGTDFAVRDMADVEPALTSISAMQILFPISLSAHASCTVIVVFPTPPF